MSTSGRPSTPRGSRRSIAMVRDATIAGVTAALTTTGIAAGANAVGISLAVDAQQIPVEAFAFWTLIGALLGTGVAAVVRTRRRFVAVAVSGTALSLVPAVVLPDDTATRAILVLTHLVAAAILTPVIARHLDTNGGDPRPPRAPAGLTP